MPAGYFDIQNVVKSFLDNTIDIAVVPSLKVYCNYFEQGCADEQCKVMQRKIQSDQ